MNASSQDDDGGVWDYCFDADGSLRLSPTEVAHVVRDASGRGEDALARRVNLAVVAALLGDLGALALYVASLETIDGPTTDNTQPLLDTVASKIAANGLLNDWLDVLRCTERPAIAVEALHACGRQDCVDLDSIADALNADEDRVILLAAAALNRNVDTAAKLAVRSRIRSTTGQTAAVIVHDVAQQRSVPDVARFIRLLHSEGESDLVVRALEYFVGRAREGAGILRPRAAEGGRSNLDIAVLYVALTAGQSTVGCADQLLTLTLDAIGDGTRVVAQTRADDVVAALWHLDRRGRLLGRWFEEKFRRADDIGIQGEIPRESERGKRLREKFAQVIRGARDGARRDLIAYIARTLNVTHLVYMYRDFVDGGRNDDAELLARSLAIPGQPERIERIADFLQRWHRLAKSERLTRDLMSVILSPEGTDGPTIDAWLVDGVVDRLAQTDPSVGETFARVSLGVANGWEGSGILDILERIPQPRFGRGRGGTASDVSRRLAARLLTRPSVLNSVGERESFLRYASVLNAFAHPGDGHPADGYSDAVEDGCEELADRSVASPVGAVTVAGVSDALATVQNGDTSLARSLLVRYLRHEQSLMPADVVTLTSRLRASPVLSAIRREVLEESIGRWQDRGRWDAVLSALDDDGKNQESQWIRNSPFGGFRH